MNHELSRCRRSLVTGGLVTLAFAVMFSGATGQEATPAATSAGVLDTPVTELDCDDSVTPVATSSYGIVSEESEVRYVAEEELSDIGANTAIGATNAVIGQILFDDAGLPLACSRFDADLRTLQSDESRRDNYLYTNTLETGQYPLATFILTSVEGLPEPLADRQETPIVLIGNLTIHGVTKAVAWEATVTKDGDAIAGSAWTTFDMSDFEIEEPVVGPVISVDETIRLEIDLTATLA